MAETRVDLRHLLEDIRDSYPCPVEEAILTEMIANSLDSACSRIEIRVEPEQRRLTLVDHGEGMSPREFEQYHDIASTAKARGKGIGFAGIGAKLALLVCREVLTETRRRKGCLCSRWWLESPFKAPWDPMAAVGLVPGEKGTGVRLHLRDDAAPALLSAEFVASTVRAHFYPLLDPEFTKVLDPLYPAGVAIAVDGEAVGLLDLRREASEYFSVRRGKRRKLLGIGFLARVAEDLPEDRRGLAISTFGKVIKRGWEWLGLSPKSQDHLTGVVELPELVECLTTTKCDFMRDPNSLQKYYQHRKAIQDAVAQALEKLGEARAVEPKREKRLAKLQREIDAVVGGILPDFPELAPLFGWRRRATEGPGLSAAPETEDLPFVAEETEEAASAEPGPETNETTESLFANLPENPEGEGQPGEGPRRRRAGLSIGFDDETGGEAMGWLRGDTLYINARHPAYERVQGTGEANLYITFAVASTLSAHVPEGRQPFEFLERFLARWGGSAARQALGMGELFPGGGRGASDAPPPRQA